MEKKITGYISQIIGPVIDISFEKDDSDTIIQLPSIHDVVSIKRPDGRVLIAEIQQRCSIWHLYTSSFLCFQTHLFLLQQ